MNQVGIVRVARSDWGHTDGLRRALGRRAITLKYTDAVPENLAAVIICGDRWEMARAAINAVHARVPIVHLHGGEHTPNVIDQKYRHAISQMASVHCVAHAVHQARLITMGIDPAVIHVTGAPGLDRYAGIPSSKKASPILVLLHPTTYRPQDAEREWEAAMYEVGENQAIFFTPGNDPGAVILEGRMRRYAHSHKNVRVIKWVSDRRWCELVKHAPVVIGNSSALVIDCPFLGVPTIEIGRRQEGRDRVSYGDGHSIPRIVEVLHASTL